MSGELGVTQIPEFFENESMTTDLAQIQQVNELLGVFEIFEPVGAFRGELDAKTLLKKCFHTISINFDGITSTVWNHNEWSCINFQAN